MSTERRSHPDDAALIAYAATFRRGADISLIEDHVTRCRRCRERLARNERVVHAVCAELRRTRWMRRELSDAGDVEEYVYRCGKGFWVQRVVVARVQVVEAATHAEAVGGRMSDFRCAATPTTAGMNSSTTVPREP